MEARVGGAQKNVCLLPEAWLSEKGEEMDSVSHHLWGERLKEATRRIASVRETLRLHSPLPSVQKSNLP